MIVIVFWTVEINLVYFAQKRRLISDCDSFLVHRWDAVNNLVYFRKDLIVINSYPLVSRW